MENHQPENLQVIIYNNPEEENDAEGLPPGFRFFPYDVELLEHYLLELVYGNNSPEGLRIPAVDLYCDAPQDLTARYEEHCENQWYFFTKRNRKYSGGNRPNRGAGNGFWKQTNVIKRVFKVHKEDKTKVELGRKITLDYYDKSFKMAGERTNWKMNEYRVNDKLPDLPVNYSSAGSSTELDEWCLCRIYISLRKGNKTDNVEAALEEENQEMPDNAQVTIAGANFVQQNAEHTIAAAAQGYNQQVVAAADPNFILQNTAPLFSNQHVVAPQEFYGQNAGRLDTNSFQQSTTPFINEAFSNFSDPFYFGNTMDGLMNWMSYDSAYGVINQEERYPVADQLHDNGFVQPIVSSPATGLPILPSYNFNQSSASIPGDVTRGPEDGSLSSLVFGNGQCSSDGGSKNGGFDQSGN